MKAGVGSSEVGSEWEISFFGSLVEKVVGTACEGGRFSNELESKGFEKRSINTT